VPVPVRDFFASRPPGEVLRERFLPFPSSIEESELEPPVLPLGLDAEADAVVDGALDEEADAEPPREDALSWRFTSSVSRTISSIVLVSRLLALSFVSVIGIAAIRSLTVFAHSSREREQ
jgi:hypothetical protein